MAETQSASSRSSSSSSSSEDETSGLAKEAVALFQARHYQECLDVLRQLLQKKPNDPKILHNIAVAGYFHDGCSEPQKLLEVLNNVKKRSEDLNQATGEQPDLANSSSANNNITPAAKGTGVATSGQLPGSDGISFVAEYDTSIATLNTAIILYNLQQYASAMTVLEPLFENIEPIDETAALRICLLMLDIALASQQAARAADVVRYMEKAFGFAYTGQTTDAGGSSQNQTSKTTITTQVNLLANESSGATTATNIAACAQSIDNNPSNAIPDDNLDYENLLSTLDSDNQITGRADLMRTVVEKPPQASGIKLILHLYKVRVLLLTRNLKATKREVKMAMKIARGRDSSTALLLKAQLEYSRGNNHKAIKLLTTCCSRSEQGTSCVFWNNLGCINHQLRKDHLASFYFKKAYQNSLSQCMEQPLKLAKFSQDKSQSIMYNLGMMHLTSENPLAAAHCFQQASSLYYSKPLLWIRWAECCILAYKKGLLKYSTSGWAMQEDELKVQILGNGKWRHIVILPNDNCESKDSSMESDSKHVNSQTSDKGEFFELNKPVKISMKFARQCLQVALWLLDQNDKDAMSLVTSEICGECKDDDESNQSTLGFKNSNQKAVTTVDSKGAGSSSANFIIHSSVNGDGRDSKGNSGSGNSLSASVEAYEEMRRRDNLAAKLSVLAKLAYVELCLKNPLKALEAAETLLKQPGCPRAYIFLGHIYAAESLCRLNRPKEVAEHLLVCIEEGSNSESCNAGNEGQKWRSTDNSEASGDGDDVGNAATFCFSSLVGKLSENQGNGILEVGDTRTTLYVNLAAVSAMQGDLQNAYQYATEAISLSPTNTLAVLSVVYVELLQGKTQEAVSKLKGCKQLRVDLPDPVSSRS